MHSTLQAHLQKVLTPKEVVLKSGFCVGGVLLEVLGLMGFSVHMLLHTNSKYVSQLLWK